MLSLEPTRTAQSRRKTSVSLLPPYLYLYVFSARPRSHKGSVVTQQHVDRGHFVTTFMRAGHVKITFNSLCHGSKENLILI